MFTTVVLIYGFPTTRLRFTVERMSLIQFSPTFVAESERHGHASSMHIRVFRLLYALGFGGLRVTGLMPQLTRRSASRALRSRLESFS